MHSSFISKVEKARAYAGERFRMQIDDLHVAFHGENSEHEVTIHDGKWACSCDFFGTWDVCSHTMALERVLTGMVPQQETPALAAVS
jgi:hypothetical protein